MTKFDKLYHKVIEIIEWAESQDHISEDAESILIENITEIANDIKEEE
ncbi:MAG: hypothetical protein IJO56_06335 [Oscillospiraceae bacterium]|nr:hypothetical protein [Oscillospiraceae bacterium]